VSVLASETLSRWVQPDKTIDCRSDGRASLLLFALRCFSSPLTAPSVDFMVTSVESGDYPLFESGSTPLIGHRRNGPGFNR